MKYLKKSIDHLQRKKNFKNNSSRQKIEKVRTGMQHVTDQDVAHNNRLIVNVNEDMQAPTFEAWAIMPQLICQRESIDFSDKEMKNVSKQSVICQRFWPGTDNAPLRLPRNKRGNK